jgi:hypothetical protein
MKFTKETYLYGIYELKKLFLIDSATPKPVYKLYTSILAKNLNGRHYIPKTTNKETLEKIYEDLVNCVSDNKIA